MQYFYALKTTDTNDNGIWSNEDSISTPGIAPTVSILSADSVVFNLVDLSGYIIPGDVIFCELSDGHFVKVYIQSVPQHATQPAAHGIIPTS